MTVYVFIISNRLNFNFLRHLAIIDINKKSSGPSTDPCGTPHVALIKMELEPLIETN